MYTYGYVVKYIYNNIYIYIYIYIVYVCCTKIFSIYIFCTKILRSAIVLTSIDRSALMEPQAIFRGIIVIILELLILITNASLKTTVHYLSLIFTFFEVCIT